MRATINFEVNADKVEETMATLVSQEAATLRIAANILDNLGDGPLLQEVNETIDLLQEAADTRTAQQRTQRAIDAMVPYYRPHEA